MYGDYLETVSRAFNQQLALIEAEHAFHHGPEFEISLCKVLRSLLPQKYGVCRGYVVAPNGDLQGDDVIIYDQHVFPAFRDLGPTDFSQLQRIPIEGVYAYFEVKNTITLDVPSEDRRGLGRAGEQVRRVRELVERREDVPLSNITKFVSMGNLFRFAEKPHQIPRRNQLFTGILARNIRFLDGTTVSTADDYYANEARFNALQVDDAVDCVILGPSVGGVPVIGPNPNGDEGTYIDPFMRPGGNVAIYQAENMSLGTFFCLLMAALERIELGLFPWQGVLTNCIRDCAKRKPTGG